MAAARRLQKPRSGSNGSGSAVRQPAGSPRRRPNPLGVASLRASAGLGWGEALAQTVLRSVAGLAEHHRPTHGVRPRPGCALNIVVDSAHADWHGDRRRERGARNLSCRCDHRQRLRMDCATSRCIASAWRAGAGMERQGGCGRICAPEGMLTTSRAE